MSRLILDKKWANAMQEKIDFSRCEKIEYIGTFKPAIQFLVISLVKAGRSFKIYKPGGGVQQLTTDTDTCPCCKRKL